MEQRGTYDSYGGVPPRATEGSVVSEAPAPDLFTEVHRYDDLGPSTGSHGGYGYEPRHAAGQGFPAEQENAYYDPELVKRGDVVHDGTKARLFDTLPAASLTPGDLYAAPVGSVNDSGPSQSSGMLLPHNRESHSRVDALLAAHPSTSVASPPAIALPAWLSNSMSDSQASPLSRALAYLCGVVGWLLSCTGAALCRSLGWLCSRQFRRRHSEIGTEKQAASGGNVCTRLLGRYRYVCTYIFLTSLICLFLIRALTTPSHYSDDAASRLYLKRNIRPPEDPMQVPPNIYAPLPVDHTPSRTLTIFTVPKPFDSQYERIQYTAIQSWLLLEPRPNIVLIDATRQQDAGVERAARQLGVDYIQLHEPPAADAAARKLPPPVVPDIMEAAESYVVEKYGRTEGAGVPIKQTGWGGRTHHVGGARAVAARSPDLMMFVHSDIVLTQRWMDSVVHLDATFALDGPSPDSFLMIGQRVNVGARVLLRQFSVRRGSGAGAGTSRTLHQSPSVDITVDHSRDHASDESLSDENDGVSVTRGHSLADPREDDRALGMASDPPANGHVLADALPNLARHNTPSDAQMYRRRLERLRSIQSKPYARLLLIDFAAGTQEAAHSEMQKDDGWGSGLLAPFSSGSRERSRASRNTRADSLVDPTSGIGYWTEHLMHSKAQLPDGDLVSSAAAKRGSAFGSEREMDYFVYPRGFFPTFSGIIPAFLLGRFKWEQYLVHWAVLKQRHVVDITDITPVFHIMHDYKHIGDEVFSDRSAVDVNTTLTPASTPDAKTPTYRMSERDRVWRSQQVARNRRLAGGDFVLGQVTRAQFALAPCDTPNGFCLRKRPYFTVWDSSWTLRRVADLFKLNHMDLLSINMRYGHVSLDDELLVGADSVIILPYGVEMVPEELR